MADSKGCNKWLTYALGLLALVFLILTIVFGVRMNDDTETLIKEVEKIVYKLHPLEGDGETSLVHPFFDPIADDDNGRAGAPILSPAVEEIYSKLTFKQKIGQLIQYSYGDASGPGMEGTPTPDDWETLAREGEVGSFLNVVDPALNNALQKAAVQGTGIPLIMGFDVIHGHRAISPNPFGLAASWDPSMVETLSALAAKEAKAEGIRWTFAPMADIARDPRWGRMMEGWGESSYLHSIFAPAVVRGFQNENVSACVKHVAAYGIPTAGKDYAGNEISWTHLHNDYFEGYEASIKAGALSTMASFNTIEGIPAHGNRELMTDVQRGLWGLKGMCVSDYGGTRELMDHRFMGEDRSEAALKSFFAGVDMNMADGYYRELFDVDPKRSFLNHTLAEYVDLSARRVVWVKEQIGLFDDLGLLPYDDTNELWGDTLMSSETLEAVREAAERSAVLLKNDGNALPVDPLDTKNKILIVGQLADDYFAHVGFWSAAGAAGSHVGAYLQTFLNATDEICGTSFSQPFDPNRKGSWCVGDDEEADFRERNRADELCDVDYLPGYACQLNLNVEKDEPLMQQVEDAIGSNSYTHVIFVAGEGYYQNGEGSSRAHLELPHSQSTLSRRIVEAALKKEAPPKLILVPIIARPNILTFEDENFDAIMVPWAPGTVGGPAIWNLLKGKVSPGGALPASFPRAMGQIPIYHEMVTTGRAYPEDSPEYPPYTGADNLDDRFKSRYIDEKIRPLYPFGYGLSYAEFTLTANTIGPSSVSIEEDTPIVVTLTAERSGSFTGKASKIYQVYIGQLRGTPVPPKKRIRGFARLDFDEGVNTASATISLIPSKDLARFDMQVKRRVEKGIYQIFLAENAEDERYYTNVTVVD